MTYGIIATDTIQSSTTGTPPQFNDGSGAQIGTLCRAWVNFNGSGGAVIRSSFNVSSVTRTATGTYTVNFTTAMSDANYSVQAQSLNWWTAINSTSTASCSVITFSGSTFVATDQTGVYVAIFR